MNWLTNHLYNLFAGFFTAFLGYFMPINSIVHVMAVAIIIDMLMGILASHKKGIGIKSSKLWNTGYKLLFALIIVHLSYAVDVEVGPDFISLHKTIAFIVVGWEIWSILENAAVISNHDIFRILKRFMEDKIEKQTGVKIKEQ